MTDTVTIALISSAQVVAVALIVNLVGKRGDKKVDKVGEAVNGRLSELLRITKVSSKAEGVKEEQDKNIEDAKGK